MMYRSRKYLEFVRSQLCTAPCCLRQADHTHHFARSAGGGGVACKPHDTYVVPLCAEHHREVHQTGMLRDCFTSELTEAHFFRMALQLLTEFLERRAA
jgi:hypothetical protein